MTQYASIVDIDDFTGDIKLAKNSFSESDIESYVVETQEQILKDLLGDDLYIKFGTALPNPASGTKYNHLLNGVIYVDPKLCGIDQIQYSQESIDTDIDVNVDFPGIKRMLKLFTWWGFVSNPEYQTIIGTVKASSQNGTVVDNLFLTAILDRKYNEAIDLYRKARKFITDHRDMETTSTSVSDNGDGTFTFFVPSTKYLVNGDIVVINANEYAISDISSNVSFKINETTGTAFNAVTDINWDAFPTFQGKKKEKSFFGGAI